jgi:hypothetical protein
MALPHIIALIKENTRRATEKVAERKREAQLQEQLIDAISSFDEFSF